MSLIIAHKLPKDCQIWCGDGLVIEVEQGRQRVVSGGIDKIYQMVPNNIAVGFSGNCYDASEILRLASHHKNIFSVRYLINDLARIVAHINYFSEIKRNSLGLPREKTGLIVGGFFEKVSFLFIIGPEGQIISAPSCAIIGAGLSIIGDQAMNLLMSSTSAEDSISQQRYLFRRAASSHVVDEIRQMVKITPDCVTGCGDLDSAHMSLVTLGSEK